MADITANASLALVVDAIQITGGVDTYLDSHTAAAVDQLGRLLGNAQFPATMAGYRRLLAWLQTFGAVTAVGVEGTGSYGAGLARFLRSAQVRVVEVDRPNRRTRRRVASPTRSMPKRPRAPCWPGPPPVSRRPGPARSRPSARCGVARRGALKARTAATNTLRQTLVTAPEPLHAQLYGLTTEQLIETASRLRVTGDLADPAQATKLALRRLAQRCQHLNAEITATDTRRCWLIERESASRSQKHVSAP